MNHNEDIQMFCENCKVYIKDFWPFSASYKIIQRSWTWVSELKTQLSLPLTSPQLFSSYKLILQRTLPKI